MLLYYSCVGGQFSNVNSPPPPIEWWDAAEATGLGFVCFVVIIPLVLSAPSELFGHFFVSNFTPPPLQHSSCSFLSLLWTCSWFSLSNSSDLPSTPSPWWKLLCRGVVSKGYTIVMYVKCPGIYNSDPLHHGVWTCDSNVGKSHKFLWIYHKYDYIKEFYKNPKSMCGNIVTIDPVGLLDSLLTFVSILPSSSSSLLVHQLSEYPTLFPL